MKIAQTAEDLLMGTPLEAPARRLWVALASFRNPRARQSLEYDRQTEAVMKRVLSRNSNCIDVGAHKGSLLSAMLKQAPGGTHLAFEPLPHLAKRLREQFPRVGVHELALSDSPGEAEFCYVVSSPGLSGFRRMRHVSANAKTQTITVQTARLDDIAREDYRANFIKVDVEGAQLQVLQGATEVLTRSHPFVVFEHGMLAHEAYGTTSEMIFDFLAATGFRISRMADWLSHRPPLSRGAFCGSVGYHAGSEFCFLAHP
jgi:FkbM family methyltransferase